MVLKFIYYYMGAAPVPPSGAPGFGRRLANNKKVGTVCITHKVGILKYDHYAFCLSNYYAI